MAQWILENPTSGNTYTTNSIEWKGRIIVDLDSQSIVNNTSTITCTFQWTRSRSASYGSNGATSYSITAGTSKSGTREAYNINPFNVNTWHNVGVQSFTISHATDGSKSQYISAYWEQSGVNPNWCSVEGTITLPTIPRTSSVSGGSGNIGATTVINVSRASNSFTHTLYYTFGSIAKTQIASGVGASYTWTIPTSFYAQLPSATSGTGTIYCDTYSGTTKVGSSTCTFTASVTNSEPTVSATIYDSNTTTTALTGNNKILVKGYSNAYVSITATAKNSASVTNRSIICGDGKSGSSTTQTLNKVTSGSFTASCRDSRGYTASNSYNLTMLSYIDCGFKDLKLERPSSTSTTINLVNLDGQFWNASFGSVTNTVTVTYQWRESGGTWSSIQTPTIYKSGNRFYRTNLSMGTTFDVNKAYEFSFTASDKLTTSTVTKTVTVGLPIIDIGTKDVNINGIIKQFSAPIIESGVNDASTGYYLKFADGTLICYGSEGLTINITNASDGAYYTSVSASFATPFLTGTKPKMFCSFTGSTGIFVTPNLTSTTNYTIFAYVNCMASKSSLTGAFHYLAIGKYK